MYVYSMVPPTTPAHYDETIALACMQGIINRDEPMLYVKEILDMVKKQHPDEKSEVVDSIRSLACSSSTTRANRWNRL